MFISPLVVEHGAAMWATMRLKWSRLFVPARDDRDDDLRVNIIIFQRFHRSNCRDAGLGQTQELPCGGIHVAGIEREAKIVYNSWDRDLTER